MTLTRCRTQGDRGRALPTPPILKHLWGEDWFRMFSRPWPLPLITPHRPQDFYSSTRTLRKWLSSEAQGEKASGHTPSEPSTLTGADAPASRARIQGLLSSMRQLSRIKGMPSSSLTCRERKRQIYTRTKPWVMVERTEHWFLLRVSLLAATMSQHPVIV